MGTTPSKLDLFGGSTPWLTPAANWTAVDDSVRGGSSTSSLSLVPDTSHVRFAGTLDTTTLGGAGFASQTTSGDQVWDLGGYDGIEVEIVRGDGKRYTLIVKDDVPEEKRGDGRERSSVNWEYDFEAGGERVGVWVPWGGFRAVYRGVERPDAGPLRTGEIKRFSLMCRSFFGKQEGEFELVLASISARKK